MKYLYIFFRTWTGSFLTFKESIQEASDIVSYERETGANVVKPWESANNIDESKLTEGPVPIFGNVRPLCHKS